jgi:single-strand DNA-binding protein
MRGEHASRRRRRAPRRRENVNNLNSILIEGNVVRDCQSKKTPAGTPLCTFSVASNRYFKQESGLEKEVSFFDVESWAKTAEICGDKARKGRGVRIVGRLKQDRWTGNDGKNYSKVKIIAEHVEFKPEFKSRDQDQRPELSPESDLVEDAVF